MKQMRDDLMQPTVKDTEDSGYLRELAHDARDMTDAVLQSMAERSSAASPTREILDCELAVRKLRADIKRDALEAIRGEKADSRLNPSLRSLALFGQACAAIIEDHLDELYRVKQDAAWHSALDVDLADVSASYQNWRYVRQIFMIRTGYTSRIAGILRNNPDVLLDGDRLRIDDHQGSGNESAQGARGARDVRVRLLAIKDDLWGDCNGLEYTVYGDFRDFGNSVASFSELECKVYDDLELNMGKNDGCIVFYATGTRDVDPDAVLDAFLHTFGSHSDHEYCGFCDRKNAKYKGVERRITVSTRAGRFLPRSCPDAYEVPVHDFFIDCESG